VVIEVAPDHPSKPLPLSPDGLMTSTLSFIPDIAGSAFPYSFIIAALRYWQRSGMADPCYRSEAMNELATNGGEIMESLNDEGIDDLVERLNCGDLELVATNCAG